MYPDASQNPPHQPANLPPVPLPGQAPSYQTPVPLQQTSSTPGAMAQPIIQAKQLVQQYASDPFRLSEAMRQLKGSYLADHFHITTKTTEN